jgi:hypothetical protein
MKTRIIYAITVVIAALKIPNIGISIIFKIILTSADMPVATRKM